MENTQKSRPVRQMILEGNLEKNWRTFKQQFEIYLIASKNHKEDEKIQCALLLHLIGENSVEIFNTFEFLDNEKDKIKPLLKKFENYFLPKRNVTYERYKYFTYKQTVGQTFNEYVTELKVRASNCNFKDLKEELVRDQIVCGILNNKLREKLLSELDLTLEKAESLCRAMELATEQADQIADSGVSAEDDKAVHNISRKETPARVDKPMSKGIVSPARVDKSMSKRVVSPAWVENKSQNDSRIVSPAYKKDYTETGNCYRYTNNFNKSKNNSKFNCTRCGKLHGINNCPAYGKKCAVCKKPNHFANVCKDNKSKQVNYVNKYPNKSTDSERNNLFLGTVKHLNSNISEWNVDLKINNVNIKFKIDTGAQANCIPINIFKKLQLKEYNLVNTNYKLSTYNGNLLDVLGTCYLKCYYKSNVYIIKFFIINVAHSPCILGLDSSVKLKLIKQVHNINNQEGFIEKYSNLFQAEGHAKIKPIHIEINKNITPVIHSPRKIPFSLLDELKYELNKLEKEKIIVKVRQPTEWVNSIVLVRKPSGKLRICMDPRNLNKAIKREHFQIPTIEQITAQLSGANFFSTLDANKGFWQLRLDEQSSKLCTFNTPYGRYRFLRLPFGISSAPEIFHSTMKYILNDIKGVEIYIDDILIWGNTKEEHDSRLKMVLDRLTEFNIKLNKDKSRFCVSQVVYLGHKISNKGIEIDETRIIAIRNIKRPEQRKEIEKFLGMTNYLSKFINHYAEITEPLRLLLRKSTPWHWEAEQETAFNKLKSIITNPPILQFYNRKQSITLSVDASKSCIGAVLLQNNRPLAYYSKPLSNSQQNYAQIEKELLAILTGCEKFYQYIYGKTVEVETDHKPLVSIFNKTLAECPLRLQKMFLRLQHFDIKLNYIPGKDLIIADALSRLRTNNVSDDNDDKKLDLEIEAQIGLILKRVEITENQYMKLQKETNSDEDLNKLKWYIQHGWPENKYQIPDSLKQYRAIMNEISNYSNLIFKGDQIVIPKTMRKEMLNRLHVGHFGMEKMKLRARDCIYWPGINKEIENLVQSCHACNTIRNSQRKEPISFHEIPNKTWTKIGMDLFNYDGKNYLIMVDYYSKYFETIYVPKLASAFVINQIKHIFSRIGIPEIIISDNGPQFSSEEFKKFSSEWDFKHITSSPTYPQSNGLAERYIQTIKNVLKKCKLDNSDPYLAMLELRNNAIYGEYSPSELMFGRKLRGLIPNLKRKHINHKNYQQSLRSKQNLQKTYYNEHSKSLEPLSEGSKVRVQRGKVWIEGDIIEYCSRPRSYKIKLRTGQIIERNRRYIRLDNTQHTIDDTNKSETDQTDSDDEQDSMYWKNNTENSEDAMKDHHPSNDERINDTTFTLEQTNNKRHEDDVEIELSRRLSDNLSFKGESSKPVPQVSSRGRRLIPTKPYWIQHKK